MPYPAAASAAIHPKLRYAGPPLEKGCKQQDDRVWNHVFWRGGWGGWKKRWNSLLAGLLDALLAGVEGAFAFCFCGHFGARFGVCNVLVLA